MRYLAVPSHILRKYELATFLTILIIFLCLSPSRIARAVLPLVPIHAGFAEEDPAVHAWHTRFLADI